MGLLRDLVTVARAHLLSTDGNPHDPACPAHDTAGPCRCSGPSRVHLPDLDH